MHLMHFNLMQSVLLAIIILYMCSNRVLLIELQWEIRFNFRFLKSNICYLSHAGRKDISSTFSNQWFWNFE